MELCLSHEKELEVLSSGRNLETNHFSHHMILKSLLQHSAKCLSALVVLFIVESSPVMGILISLESVHTIFGSLNAGRFLPM